MSTTTTTTTTTNKKNKKNKKEEERKDFFLNVPNDLRTNIIDKFSPATFDIDINIYMNYNDDKILEEINNRLSNPNMTIGARWFHEMIIDFLLPSRELSLFRAIRYDLIEDLFNRQIATNEDGSFTTKLNAAYNDNDAPVDWPMVLLTPNQMRTIQNQEPVTRYHRSREFTYLHSVDLFENEQPVNIEDFWGIGLVSIDELFSETQLERLRSSWKGRMASLAAGACRLLLPPVETEVNHSVIKLTNNNCLSIDWWLTKLNEKADEDGDLGISITVQNNRRTDNLRSDEKGIVNLKY